MADKKTSSLTMSIALFIVAIIVTIFAFNQQSDLNNQQNANSQEIKKVQQTLKENLTKPSNFPDYDSLLQLKKVTLLSNLISWTPSSNIDPTKSKKVLVLDQGQLSKAYIYVKASLDNKPLTQWESIYLTMNWTGGHLFRPQSLPVPASDRTELLYAINYVPYLSDTPYNEQSVPLISNWFPYFIEGNIIEVDIFISSLRPALLEEVTIYYQCIKNSDCLLTLR